MHKALAFYEGTIRSYQLLHKQLKKNTLNPSSEQWRYWVQLAPQYKYKPTVQGVKELRADLTACEVY